MRQGWIAATIYGFLLFTQGASAASISPNVVVVHPPLFPLVEEIMRGSGKPQLLLNAGQDSHHLQLTTKQAALLANADMLIIADRGLSPSLNKQLNEREKKGARVIALTELEGADPLTYRSHNAFSDEAEHTHGIIDPHLWLDPVRMAKTMPSLAHEMGTANPAFASTYRMNATSLAAHLSQALHIGLRGMLSSIKPASEKDVIPYITYHDAYQYFEQRYDLQSHGHITQRPEEYIGAKSMKTLVESARNQRVRCLISESASPLAKRFELQAGAKIVLLSPERLYSAKDAPSAPWIRNDYDRSLAKIARTFADCISGKLSK